jgi:hypothetical protein
LRGPGGDQYLYAHTQFDIQGSYRLWNGLHLVVSGLNLSNEVFGFYQGSGIYPIQREFYKPSVLFGFRWNSGGTSTDNGADAWPQDGHASAFFVTRGSGCGGRCRSWGLSAPASHYEERRISV